MLVFDEATSNLDPESEHEVQRALEAVLPGPHRAGDRPPPLHRRDARIESAWSRAAESSESRAHDELLRRGGRLRAPVGAATDGGGGMKSTGIWIPPPGTRRRRRQRLWPWAVLALGVCSWWPTPREYPLGPATGAPRQEAAGAYHVHTTRSDGRGTAHRDRRHRGAAPASTSWCSPTTTSSQLDAPAYVHGVLMVPATGISTPTGHLVALGASRALTAAEARAGPIAHVTALGGYAVLAHPVQTKMPWRDSAAAPRARGLRALLG